MTAGPPRRGTPTMRIGVADIERRPRRQFDDERSPLVDRLAEILDARNPHSAAGRRGGQR